MAESPDTHVDPGRRLELLRDAILELPPSEQEAVHQRLVHVAVDYEATRDLDPVARFLDSLIMTARLHRNPAYLKSLSEADEAADGGEPSDTFDISSLFARKARERTA